jgi:hypothetical protein
MQLFKTVAISEDKKDRANPENLWTAAFVVLARYQREGKEPGAECWQADTRWKRPILIEDIRAEWLSIVGGDYLFPWSDDFVIDIWVSMRKAQKYAKAAFCEELGIEVPAKWKSGD